MVAFDAGSAVEPMDWDFSKFGAGSGTIPEPSDVEIERFMRKYQILTTQVLRSANAKTNEQVDGLIKQWAEEEDPNNPREILTVEQSMELMERIDLAGSEVAPEISEAMLELVLTITKGSPSREQILSLPNRVRGAFYGWLFGQLTDPDFSVAVGTKPSLSLVNGG